MNAEKNDAHRYHYEMKQLKIIQSGKSQGPGIIGVRDRFRLGAQHFFARISYPCPKVEYVWAMHFCRTLGGGGGVVWRRRTLLFRSDCIWNQGGGGCGWGYPPSHGWGRFWILGY